MDMTPTYFWMGLFFISGVLFWGIALWAIVRGGKDVIEILRSETAKEKRTRIAARPSAEGAE